MSFFHPFTEERSVPPHPEREPLFPAPLTAAGLEAALGGSEDVGRRDLRLWNGREAVLFFIDGLVDPEQVSRSVLAPLQRFRDPELRRRDLVGDILARVSESLSAHRCGTLDDALDDLLEGWSVLVVPGESAGVSFEVKGGSTRGVQEPSVENVVKGAKDAFVETLRVNTALVRRKIRSRELRIESAAVGRRSHTRVSVVSLEGLTDRRTVEDVLRRLEETDTDALLTPAAVEEHLVRSSVATVFPLAVYSDLVDVFCRNLLAGRVGLLVDGLPLGYLLPATAAAFLTAPEDGGSNHIVASFIRGLRYVALFVTLVLPGFYVAVASFHQEMIPFRLMSAIAASKQNVPFSTTVEVIGMLIAFEILQEAGLRLPKTIGQTVSIVGALIVGQSAVEAKIFSPAVVIVVAIAGVAGYTIPNQDFAAAVRLWRLITAVSGAMLGMFGVAASVMVLLYHLCTIETFGVAYMEPFAGGARGSAVRRRPTTAEKLRPEELRARNVRREGP